MLKSTVVSICGHVFIVGTCLLIANNLPVKDVPCFVDLTLVSIQTIPEKNAITEINHVAVQHKQKKQCENKKILHERTAVEHNEQTNRDTDTIVQTQPDSLPDTTDSSINNKREGDNERTEKGTITGTVEHDVSAGDTEHISFTDHSTNQTNEFSYIASIITKNTRYPPFAEEMEISGTVVLEFVVSKEGVVNNVAIVKSSGYAILDNDAIRTIKISSPFPSSRVTARIMFPMEYRLSSAE
ncbi:MAG TPA: energy transducer TonB [Chitinispirillaceae bacterium]|nr:energy transducer TonB [Chitinispirillaceae bacterium]